MLVNNGNLTAESTKEQSSAGLQNLTEQERQKMNHLNQQYKQKFGFPFVICYRTT
jgi:2-oxo-4-hydroxy-4-carboxy-5-ureidoimidazoline decarboxylase